MKTLKYFLILITLVFLQYSVLAQTTITIIHVNDSHSKLDAFGPKDADLNGTIGGLSKAASVIGYLKATQPNPILLHAGDASVGDLFFNQYLSIAELQILNNINIRFDAMAVGNHELDLGADLLAYALSESFPEGGFPLLSANMIIPPEHALNYLISPSTIKECSGVKVGIFGMTTPALLTQPDPIVISDDIGTIAYNTITALKADGADVIIMLSHLGLEYDKMLASQVPYIDFIIGGHDHYVLENTVNVTNPSGKITRIVQAGENYLYVGKLKFEYENGNITMDDYSLLPVKANTPPVPEIQTGVNELKAEIVSIYGDVYNTQIGYAQSELFEHSVPNKKFKDTPMGNLVTDAFRYNSNTDIAITANGLISDRIYKGPIVGADIFRSVAYGFDLVTVDIDGINLITGLEAALAFSEYSEDYFLQVSGFSFTYNDKKPIGERVILSSLLINGQPINPYATYSLTVNKGLFDMLEMMEVTVSNVTFTEINEYVALTDFIANMGTINYVPEGRVKDKNNNSNNPEEIVVNTPNEFKLNNNYPNPFNPMTNISYTIGNTSNVKLVIYNSLGQVITTLVDTKQDAGDYNITWNASGYPSGLYFYSLESGSFRDTKKMILVK